MLHLVTAHVEVAVSQAHRFVDLDAIVELKGRRLGEREHLDLTVGQLDLPVASRSLTVPSGRGGTVPVTRTTYSLRTSTDRDDGLDDARSGRECPRRRGARRARAAWRPSRTR